MANSEMCEVIQHLRRAVLLREGAGLTDGQLLEDYLSRRNDAALAALVRRHGPMVWGVCRRVLRHYHDAEDAFQATFLVLVRKAPSIASRELLANWLYGVAYQTALNARATAARRGTRERQVTQMPEAEVVDQDLWHDLQPLLDQELSRLPDKYRIPIVLCDLKGQTRKEASQQLGCPEGTVAGRLARARAILAKRLARHGLAVSGGSLAAALAQNAASASAPVAVVSSTIQAAPLFAAGQAAATSVVSGKVAALAEGVLKTMFITKLKSVLVVFMAAGLIACGIGFGALSFALAEPGRPGRVEIPSPAARNQEPIKAPPTWQFGATLQGHGDAVGEVAFSADGKRLASSSSDKTVIVWDVAKRESVHTLSHSGAIHSVLFAPGGKTLVTASGFGNEDYLITFWDLETGKEQFVLKGHPQPVHRLALSQNGRILVSAHTSLSGRVPPGERGDVFFWDVGTKKKMATLQTDMVHTAILSHDGKKMVTAHGDGTVKLREIDGEFRAKEETLIVENQVCSLRISPDGKRFVVVPPFVRSPVTINLSDFGTGKVVQSFEHKNVSVWDAAVSPDGKTLVTGCRRTIKKGENFELAGEVKVWDVASGEEKQSLSEKLGPVHSIAFSPDGRTLAVGLLHKENIKLKDEKGGFVDPVGGYSGAVVLCELKVGKR